jgi:hypothetical protein
MRTAILGPIFVGLLTLAPDAAIALPHRPPPTPAAVAPPATPELVPQDPSEAAGTLRRFRIYLVRAPASSTAFGALGPGPQLWFVLPSCRPPQPDDPRDFCPIERLEVTAVHGTVRPGAMTTVMDGEIPRRVQAFAVAPGADILRVRLIGLDGAVRFEAALPVSGLGSLALPAGRATPTGFDIDFAAYPAR